MQASKIKIGAVYAYGEKDALQRFHVTAVVTRRTSNTGSPHDYDSTVEGFIVEDNPGFTERTIIAVDPGKLHGPYEDYKALVERKAREEAEAKAKTEAAEARRKEAGALLAELLDLPLLQPREYNSGVRVSSSSVDIQGQEVVDRALEGLRRLKALVEPSRGAA